MAHYKTISYKEARNSDGSVFSRSFEATVEFGPEELPTGPTMPVTTCQRLDDYAGQLAALAEAQLMGHIPVPEFKTADQVHSAPPPSESKSCVVCGAPSGKYLLCDAHNREVNDLKKATGKTFWPAVETVKAAYLKGAQSK